MNTTVRIKQSQVYKDWHVIDAAGRPLGRVATEVAFLLKGKHKPTYEPHLDDGDFVIVINASQVRVSGNKAQQINYYSHSGYPGGLKTRSYAVQLEKFPERVLEKAIWGMLPKGPLGKQMFKHLKVYKNANHPHQSQITGSQKAQEARLAATAELATATMKAPRLRPLSVPVINDVEATTKQKAATPAAVAAREAKARVRQAAAEAPAVVVEEVTAAVVEAPAEVPAPKPRARKVAVETVAVEAGTVETPKRAPRRKAVEAVAPDAEATSEEKKPVRRRAAAKSEGTEE